MFASKVATRTAASAARTTGRDGQRRGIVNFLTNYPDKVMELKKVQVAGGVKQGEVNPTWLKQPGDQVAFGIGAGLTAFGLLQYVSGLYKLATGTGKMD